MNLDKYGLPVQSNGDASDQLQRVGMIVSGAQLGGDTGVLPVGTLEACHNAIDILLQPEHGVYVRNYGNATNNVSADQLISALAAHVARGDKLSVFHMYVRMYCRLGFAQNYRNGLASETIQVPDFMYLRAMPLVYRASRWFYPLAMVADVYLLVMAISAVLYAIQSPNNVDQMDTVLTLAVCSNAYDTPFSWLARKLFAKLLPKNFGSPGMNGPKNAAFDEPNNVQAALNWYNRLAAGGNPEIAQLWRPVVYRLFS